MQELGIRPVQRLTSAPASHGFRPAADECVRGCTDLLTVPAARAPISLATASLSLD